MKNGMKKFWKLEQKIGDILKLNANSSSESTNKSRWEEDDLQAPRPEGHWKVNVWSVQPGEQISHSPLA